tara:strand:- start:806 stop:1063 length:258 start_codon:yes stop_codon:yes gene_type:complete
MMLNPDTQQYSSTGERIDTHDGNIFCNIEDAKEYAQEAIDDKQCTRFAIGTFVMDLQRENMTISLVETFGFRNDKKNVSQLSLFV